MGVSICSWARGGRVSLLPQARRRTGCDGDDEYKDECADEDTTEMVKAWLLYQFMLRSTQLNVQSPSKRGHGLRCPAHTEATARC